MTLDDQKHKAKAWFETLRDDLCAAFERVEDEAGDLYVFVFKQRQFLARL